MADTLTTAPKELFWYWVNERHAIYLKKARGESKPWSVDPIFQTYKFTNVFRELDTGTVWLRENFLSPHANAVPRLLIFNCGWYRMFNWKGTGELLGWQESWNETAAVTTLKAAQAKGQQVFTGAHIVRSAFDMPKVDSIASVCTDLWNASPRLAGIAKETHSLQAVFKELLKIPYIGPFMAYEIVTDIRHTSVLRNACDIMTWANAGPGALRGLRRLGMMCSTQSRACESMEALLEDSIKHAAEHIPHMEMRDIEHSLCEFDKYCRVKFNEGNRPRGRYAGK